MANYHVYEFFRGPNQGGVLDWPADKGTAASSSGTVTTDAKTKTVVITCDSNGALEIGGSLSVGAASVPVLSGVPNQIALGAGASGIALQFS